MNPLLEPFFFEHYWRQVNPLLEPFFFKHYWRQVNPLLEPFFFNVVSNARYGGTIKSYLKLIKK